MTVQARPARHPVITAWSSVSPYGMGADALSHGAGAGTPTEAPVDRERWPLGDTGTRTACLVPNFEVREVMGKKGTRSMDRVTGFLLSAVGQLIDDGVENGLGTGLVVGTTNGSLQSAWNTTTDILTGDKPFYIDPAQIPYAIMNGATGRCAIWHGLQGPNTTVAAGRTSALTALNYARRLLANGRAERVLCGGAEEFSPARSWLDQYTRAEESTAAVGEGCAMLVVEADVPHGSTTRTPLADVLAVDFGTVPPGTLAESLTERVRRALRTAGASADEVWAASAGGVGDDADIERQVHEDLFGARALRTVPPVGLLGDTAAATGAFQIALVLGAAAAQPESAGKYAVVTTVDRDGSLACAVLKLRGATT